MIMGRKSEVGRASGDLHHWRKPRLTIGWRIWYATPGAHVFALCDASRGAFGVLHWTFLRILWQSDGLTQRELSMRAGVTEPTTFTASKGWRATSSGNRPPQQEERLHCLTPGIASIESNRWRKR
jgi:hypothetical protein